MSVSGRDDESLLLPALQALRRAKRGAAWQPLAWEVAFDHAAERITGIVRQHGPASVGFVVSGWLAAESAYLFGKIARGLIGTPHIDSTSRLGSGSLEDGLAGRVPPLHANEIEHAKTILVAGANPACTQPALFERIQSARAAGSRLIVIDPRRTATAEAADLHLQLLPGSDVVLFHAMLHLLLWEGFADSAHIRQHTSGFEALRDRVREFTPAHAARSCGLRADDIVQAARWFGEGAPALSLIGQGLNQSASGAERIGSLNNLHLATGHSSQLGRPGRGPRWLAGQPQALALREAGALAHLLPGARDIGNQAERAEVAQAWGLAGQAALPARGWSVVQMLQAAADGEIKALWIAGADPARSLPDQANVRRALERAEFVVLQDARAGTATAAWADLQLPPGRWPRADWRIAAELARRLEPKLPARRCEGHAFDGDLTHDELWAEYRRLADRTAEPTAGVAQPTPAREAFVAPAWRPCAEVRDARYPVSLLSGRPSADAEEPALELHPQELSRRRWLPGDVIRVSSRRGELLLPVRASASVLPAQAFIANLRAREVLAGGGCVNTLTAQTACPQTQQPELKHAAVRLDKPELAWSLVAAAWLDDDGAATTLARLREVVGSLRFASVWSFGRRASEQRVGVCCRAAGEAAPPAEVVMAVEAALQLQAASVLRYADARAGQHRVLRLDGLGTLQGYLFAGDTRAAASAHELLREGRFAAAGARALLAGARPPATTPVAGSPAPIRFTEPAAT